MVSFHDNVGVVSPFSLNGRPKLNHRNTDNAFLLLIWLCFRCLSWIVCCTHVLYAFGSCVSQVVYLHWNQTDPPPLDELVCSVPRTDFSNVPSPAYHKYYNILHFANVLLQNAHTRWIHRKMNPSCNAKLDTLFDVLEPSTLSWYPEHSKLWFQMRHLHHRFHFHCWYRCHWFR